MENKTNKYLPIAISVIGVLIAGYGSFRQGQGGGGTITWIGIAIVFVGVFATAAAKKPKD